MIAQQREYKKKKALKKAQRIKELEQEREDQKVKWQQFNNRAYSKNKKGQVSKSFHHTCFVNLQSAAVIKITLKWKRRFNEI